MTNSQEVLNSSLSEFPASSVDAPSQTDLLWLALVREVKTRGLMLAAVNIFGLLCTCGLAVLAFSTILSKYFAPHPWLAVLLFCITSLIVAPLLDRCFKNISLSLSLYVNAKVLKTYFWSSLVRNNSSISLAFLAFAKVHAHTVSQKTLPLLAKPLLLHPDKELRIATLKLLALPNASKRFSFTFRLLDLQLANLAMTPDSLVPPFL